MFEFFATVFFLSNSHGTMAHLSWLLTVIGPYLPCRFPSLEPLAGKALFHLLDNGDGEAGDSFIYVKHSDIVPRITFTHLHPAHQTREWEGNMFNKIIPTLCAKVTQDEFISGILRCKGEARAIEQVAMHSVSWFVSCECATEYWRPTMACCVQVLVVWVYELGVIIYYCSLVGVAKTQHVKTI